MAKDCYKMILLASLLASFVAGCGTEADERAVDASGQDQPVVLATKAELAQGRTLEGSYIVTFRTDSGNDSELYFPGFAAEHRHHFARLAERHLADPRIKDLQFLASANLADPSDTAWTAELGAPPALRFALQAPNAPKPIGAIARVDFTGEEDAAALLREWDAAGAVWYAEPNYVSRLSQEQPAPSNPAPTNETLFGKLATDYGKLNYWWLTTINLQQALQSIATRDLSVAGTPTDEQLQQNGPIVAVLDSGVDYEHPALKNQIWVNNDVNAAGCENDVHGCNTTVARRGRLGNGDVWPFDTTGPNQSCFGRDNNCSHGTHVTGIIAADHSWGDSEFQRPTAGTCPVCRIMILKIVSKVGKESGILDSSIIAALKYVSLFRREGNSAVRVVNASFGKFVRSRAVGVLVRLMKEKRGTLLVAAAGNEDTLTMEFPAAFSDAIAVSAVDQNLRKVSFSNFGRWVDISAPGSGILSTVPGGGVDVKSGTSMASPMVAGVAGLMVARYPDISFDDLRHSILQGADPSFYAHDFQDGFNYQNYYPKVPQEDARQPLLGLGVLNANSAINRVPTEGLPLYSSLDRVRRGCGVVGSSPVLSLLLWGFGLGLPLAFAGLFGRRRRG